MIELEFKLRCLFISWLCFYEMPQIKDTVECFLRLTSKLYVYYSLSMCRTSPQENNTR